MSQLTPQIFYFPFELGVSLLLFTWILWPAKDHFNRKGDLRPTMEYHSDSKFLQDGRPRFALVDDIVVKQSWTLFKLAIMIFFWDKGATLRKPLAIVHCIWIVYLLQLSSTRRYRRQWRILTKPSYLFSCRNIMSRFLISLSATAEIPIITIKFGCVGDQFFMLDWL